MRLARAFVTLTFLGAAGALGAPRTIDDCEKIEAPLAYNACLASFGPKAGQHYAPSLGSMPVSHGARASRPRPLGGVRRTFSGLPVRQIGGGRVRMEFAPKR